jgi:hypothetical protein
MKLVFLYIEPEAASADYISFYPIPIENNEFYHWLFINLVPPVSTTAPEKARGGSVEQSSTMKF